MLYVGINFVEALALVAMYGTYLITSCYIFLAIYRLLFHPLSKYPGPLAAKLSGLYGAFYAFRTDLHLRTWRDHLTYGPIVRHGPNKLVFNSVNALHDIYQNKYVTKSAAYLVTQRAPGLYSLFNAIDRHLHYRKRKLVAPIVCEWAIRKFELIMLDQIDIFIQQLLLSCRGGGGSDRVNMAERLKYLTIDIMGLFAFSYPLNLQKEKTYRFMANNTVANFCLNVALQLPSLSNLYMLDLQLTWALIRGNGYLDILEKMIRKCLSRSQDAKQDLLYMTESSTISEDDDVTIAEIRSEAVFLISAGSDTLTACLSALLYYLLENPRCYRRLIQEIRSAFNSNSEIQTGSRLANCRYLRACLDESLRLSPPVPGTLWREQASEDDAAAEPLFIDGHSIPPGTQTGVNIYSIHHNEKYFPEPFAFKPERWLPGFPETEKTTKDAFVPFSLGIRGCIGKTLAYHEASLIMAKILWYFDFEKAPGTTAGLQASRHWEIAKSREGAKEYPIGDIFGAAHDGPWLKFHPRGDHMRDLSTEDEI
ncbi:cytochrome P450 [Xylariaceae sp. FL0662B]|nr:cytochrome P450 [Xylariaceae sp. FL0662B]